MGAPLDGVSVYNMLSLQLPVEGTSEVPAPQMVKLRLGAEGHRQARPHLLREAFLILAPLLPIAFILLLFAVPVF